MLQRNPIRAFDAAALVATFPETPVVVTEGRDQQATSGGTHFRCGGWVYLLQPVRLEKVLIDVPRADRYTLWVDNQVQAFVTTTGATEDAEFVLDNPPVLLPGFHFLVFQSATKGAWYKCNDAHFTGQVWCSQSKASYWPDGTLAIWEAAVGLPIKLQMSVGSMSVPA